MLQRIPTSCETFDKILGGGFPTGEISLIYGEPETGKTTLAMQCAANCARQGCKTLFVDCDNTFSARRLSQIASEDFKDIAELIILIKPKNFSEQASVIDSLTNYLTKSFSLVVVDTFTSLYRAEIAEHPEKTFELNRELNRQIACLAQTAKTQKIGILVISQVRSVFNGTYISIEPVATRVLKFWANIIIFMKPTENPRLINAVLEKSPKMAQHLFCQLKIEERGIHEHLIH
ncbi:MAG: ATPase domain-containing protein [Candidatus Bathyarchaeia archaeon]